MLQWINDRMKVIGWVFILPLGLVFAVWGVQGIVSFSAQQDRGLKVNGQQVNFEEMRQSYQQRTAQLSRAYPEEIPADVKKKVQDAIVEEFVSAALIDQKVTADYMELHLRIGIDSLCQLINQGLTVKHLRF